MLFLALIPTLSPAEDRPQVTPLPEVPTDFKHYLYDSELLTQVFLNDRPLFEALIILKENGEIRLTKIVNETPEQSGEQIRNWAEELRRGITLGPCQSRCASGLSAAEYRLNDSTLRLFTRQYETSKTPSAYLPLPDSLPGGLIVRNDLSATSTGSSQSWGLESALLSSLGGWTQKAAFYSSGSNGQVEHHQASLYELYTQKELAGHFIRLGFFTPESDTSNVQTAGFGYHTLLGALWGTSETLRTHFDSVSIWPVYVTGRNQSLAEVWQDGRLISTQQLQAGIQPLDTRRLPSGIYDVTIKIIENGQTVDTQLAQIFKPQGWNAADRRWRMNLWGGQRRTLGHLGYRTPDESDWVWGGGMDILLHPRAIVGASASTSPNENNVRTRANVTLSPKESLFAQYTLSQFDDSKNDSTDIRYYRTLAAGNSAHLFWRTTRRDFYGQETAGRHTGHTWGSSLSLRLPSASSLIVSGQYMDTAWRKGAAADVSLNTQLTVAKQDVTVRVSVYDHPGFENRQRDRGVALRIGISLSSANRHSISAEMGVNEGHEYSSLNYQWQPEENRSLRRLGAGLSYSQNDVLLTGSGTLDSQYVSGDFYAQQATRQHSHAAGVNLSQRLVLSEGQIATESGLDRPALESALIVDVEADHSTTGILASGPLTETRLQAGRNIVPMELWKKQNIQFSTPGGDVMVFPDHKTVQMNRGSVEYVKLRAVKTVTLVGQLQDETGRIVTHRSVRSDVANGVINAEGVLTLDSGIQNRHLSVEAQGTNPALQCQLPEPSISEKKVIFIPVIHCQSQDAS